jgi:hypothetical protein
MDKELVARFQNLKERDRIKINDKIFTIQKRDFQPANPENYEEENTSFELGDNYFLVFTGNVPAFYQVRWKKHIFGFTSGGSKPEKIESIEII